MNRKFAILWGDNQMTLPRLANIFNLSITEIVEAGHQLGLDGHLDQVKRCKTCWYNPYCNQREIKLYADRLPCEGGEPVPYIEPGYTVYRSPVGNVRIQNET